MTREPYHRASPVSSGGIAVTLALLVGGILVAAAVLVVTERWAAFFAHPQVDAPITFKGAQMWRSMLAISAATLVAAALTIRSLAPTGEPTPQLADHIGRSRVYALLGVVVLGLLLRALRISESLWYDEIASWQTYNGGVHGFGAIMGAFLDPINHTFHTLLNRWSVQWLVGEMRLEIAFRMPSLLFSLATIPVMFGLGHTASGDRVGWISALLAAVAPVCVLEGVEARGYAQMIFFSAAATWALIEGLRRGDLALWLVYAVCCALGVWSQFVTAWLAIGHGAWLLWFLACNGEYRQRCAQGLVALALGGVLSITLHAPLIPGLLAWRSNFAAARPDQPRILGLEGWHALLQLGGSWYWWAAMPGLILLVAGLVRVLRGSSGRSARLLDERHVVALPLLGLPLMLVVVAISGTWLYARFMLFAMPGAILAAALGVDRLWSGRASAGLAAIVVVCIGFAFELVSRPPKQPLREAVAFVHDRAHPGERVLAIGIAHDVLSIYGMELNIAHSFMLGRDLDEKLDAVQPTWIIVEYPHLVSEQRRGLLSSRGYAPTAGGAFRGWADWGQGDVIVWARLSRP